MPDSTVSPGTVVFGRIAATVPVRDIQRALDFYVGVLGMSVTFTNGDPVGFVILDREGAELHLTLDPDHQASAQNVAHLLVDNATNLYDQLQSHQVSIVKRLRDPEHGLRGFVFADPDGNRIDVGQNL